jgi:L-malate glycosyltransferase
MRIDQLTSGFSTGDAISGDIRQWQAAFKRWGHESDIFVDPRYASPKLRGICRDYREYPKLDSAENILFFHFSIGSRFYEMLQNLKCRKVMKYHNITPAKFFAGIDQRVAESLDKGREELKRFATVTDLALGDSEYNRCELEDAGYKNTGVVPILLDLNSLDHKPDPDVMKLGATAFTNIIFVGRIVPNKKYEDIIKCFYYYQKTINNASRLFLVGSYEGTQNYYTYLKAMVNELGLNNVIFTGHVSDEEWAAYYRLADIFLCMSEHEGFCIPLVEAMHRGIPAVAYRAAAVGETLGDSGVLFAEKRYEEIAETIHLLTTDKPLRQRIINGQKKRLEDFAPKITEQKLKDQLSKWSRV